MINKILIIDSNPKEREQLEVILREVVQHGGEIIMTERRKEGLAIIKKEHPQLVFIDASAIGNDREEWNHEGVRIVIMRRKNDVVDEESVVKPFKSHQILEKCDLFLSKEPQALTPPM